MGAIVCGAGQRRTSSPSMTSEGNDDSDGSSVVFYRVNPVTSEKINCGRFYQHSQGRSLNRDGKNQAGNNLAGRKRQVSMAWVEEVGDNRCVFCADSCSPFGDGTTRDKGYDGYCTKCQKLVNRSPGDETYDDRQRATPLQKEMHCCFKCGVLCEPDESVKQPTYCKSCRTVDADLTDDMAASRDCYPYLCTVCRLRKDDQNIAKDYPDISAGSLCRLVSASTHKDTSKAACTLCQIFSGVPHQDWDSLDDDVMNASEAIKVMSEVIEELFNESESKEKTKVERHRIKITTFKEDPGLTQIVIRTGWTSYHIHGAELCC